MARSPAADLVTLIKLLQAGVPPKHGRNRRRWMTLQIGADATTSEIAAEAGKVVLAVQVLNRMIREAKSVAVRRR